MCSFMLNLHPGSRALDEIASGSESELLDEDDSEPPLAHYRVILRAKVAPCFLCPSLCIVRQMIVRAWRQIVIAIVLTFSRSLVAQEFRGQQLVTPSLIADTTAIVP